MFLCVVGKITQMHVMVALIEQCARDRSKQAAILSTERAIEQTRHDSAYMRVGVVHLLRRVAQQPPLYDLSGGQPEDVDVVSTHVTRDFYVGAIESADGHCTVHGKFHVDGAGGFVARRGNLF